MPLIPNHWLPVLAIARKDNWSIQEITWVTFLCGLAHAFSTIHIGVILGLAGWRLTADFTNFAKVIAPAVLVFMGVSFIYQHHRHHHFHVIKQPDSTLPKIKIVALLTTAMFFSPCLEVEGYFLVAGTKSVWMILIIALIYLSLSIGGMLLWVRWAFKKSLNFDWHALEHNSGVIKGATLIATGFITFFFH